MADASSQQNFAPGDQDSTSDLKCCYCKKALKNASTCAYSGCKVHPSCLKHHNRKCARADGLGMDSVSQSEGDAVDPIADESFLLRENALLRQLIEEKDKQNNLLHKLLAEKDEVISLLKVNNSMQTNRGNSSKGKKPELNLNEIPTLPPAVTQKPVRVPKIPNNMKKSTADDNNTISGPSNMSKRKEDSFVNPRKTNKSKNNKTKRNETIIGTSEDCEVSAVPRLAFLHVSNLSVATSVEDLTSMLKRAHFEDFYIEKLNSKYPESYSSFKFTIQADDLERIKNPALWAKRVKINRFFHKGRKQVNTK